MARLIDADAMEKTMCDTVRGDIRHYPYGDTEWDMAFKWIDYQPTIDAVPVVRCKDCKNWNTDWQTIEGQHYCPMVDKQTLGDFFCADGERREE